MLSLFLDNFAFCLYSQSHASFCTYIRRLVACGLNVRPSTRKMSNLPDYTLFHNSITSIAMDIKSNVTVIKMF